MSGNLVCMSDSPRNGSSPMVDEVEKVPRDHSSSRQWSVSALIALVLGLISILPVTAAPLVSVFTSVAAIVMALYARKELKAHQSRSGMIPAIIGLLAGAVVFFLTAFPFIISLALIATAS